MKIDFNAHDGLHMLLFMFTKCMNKNQTTDRTKLKSSSLIILKSIQSIITIVFIRIIMSSNEKLDYKQRSKYNIV